MTQTLKYSQDSYIRHPRLIVTANDFTCCLDVPLNSRKLLIKWHCLKSSIPNDKSNAKAKLPESLNGSCEMRVKTPIGDLFPEQFALKIAVGNDKLIQFLEIPDNEIEYYLHFRNPPTIDKSFVEVWERKLSENPL